MRIVFLTRSLAVGGAERQLVTLAAGLVEAGHEAIICSFYSEVPLAEGLDRKGVQLHVVGKDRRWNLVYFSKRLIHFLRTISPDVIHTYLPVPNLLGALLRPVFRSVPLVWGVRSSNMDLRRFDLMTRVTYGVEPWFARFADRVIVNSEAGLRHCLAHGFPKNRMTVIPNGISVDDFRPDAAERSRVRAELRIADDSPLIGMVARIDPNKDHDTFLKAAKLVSAELPRVRFVCVGDGNREERRRLQDLADAEGLSQHLTWLGMRNDVRAVYNACDVFCSSSLSEGFPNSLAEAMACGTPCVATDAGDSRLIVGDAGRVVPVGDDRALADALVATVLEAGALRQRARERIVASFSVETLVRRTSRELEALLS